MKKYLLLSLFLVVLIAKNSYSKVEDRSVLVFAAASTANAVSEIAKVYEKQTKVRVKLSFASSSTLAKQIENGAPVDIFISANPEWLDYLKIEQNFARSKRIDLLGNKLVLIAPKESSVSINMGNVADFSETFSGQFAMGDSSHVPAGIYGKQALTNMGWWRNLSRRTVNALDTRIALTYVERGEADLGLVYQTDVLISDRVKVVGRIPASLHEPIIYPAAILNPGNGFARDFFAFLRTRTARKIFREFGFDQPETGFINREL